jgi:hypothetical protein
VLDFTSCGLVAVLSQWRGRLKLVSFKGREVEVTAFYSTSLDSAVVKKRAIREYQHVMFCVEDISESRYTSVRTLGSKKRKKKRSE